MDSKDNNRNEAGPGGVKAPLRGLAVWFLLLALFLTTYQVMKGGQERFEDIPYSPNFVQMIEEGQIRKCEIVLDASGFRHVRGELIELDEAGRNKKFRVNVADTEELQRLLVAKGVHFKITPQNPFMMQLLSSIIPFILILGLLYFLFMRQMKMAGKGAMSFGKSRARLLTRGKHKITFSDVAGIEEAKEELMEIVDFLKDPKKFQKLGGRIPKGVLLVGPPGTGKTLLAKAIAGEANVPFFSISGSDFVEMFVGVGASRVRDMFEQGKKNAPCIIFIDEIDAVGRSRFTGIGGGHDEREQTLNALLVEMDGFDTQEGIILIAATNRPDVLDNALLRPGRFDRQVYVDLPGVEGRENVLKIHVKKIKLASDVDLRRVARGTPGFSGADLANLVNEAALLAARRGAEAVELKDMEEARDKVRWGRERRSRIMDDKEKLLTAYHEAGHAILMMELEDSEPLHKVTIIPRGQSLGSTMQLPEKDQYTQSRGKLLTMLAVFMGGRAAEEIACSDITTGAQNDIQQATRIARAMVCEWGMSETLGPQAFGGNHEVMFLGKEVSRQQEMSEETARKVDGEVNRLIHDAYDKARSTLIANREKLELLTKALIEWETLDGQEVEDLFKTGVVNRVKKTDGDAGPGSPRATVAPASDPAAPLIGPASANPSLA
ncbi:MAG TPA: ATP-dependent zinc metalloprotease FtsH [Kiritimatiellia bacterium]|nr:ATP-dependent zinc metalloprotease FtsH [Kiritimatiellia bacterium]HMO98402.1 ATP-dependent zinc metalloprotease FtsH [Kiritimatiellia bacterium]HMP96455.1 ATP-dependent zinc metalloprotease FtsH [Kiritimatiellia bacterium]